MPTKKELREYLERYISSNGVNMRKGKLLNWGEGSNGTLYVNTGLIFFFYSIDNKLLSTGKVVLKCSRLFAEKIILSHYKAIKEEIPLLYKKELLNL